MSPLYIIARINTEKIHIVYYAVAKRNRHRFFITKTPKTPQQGKEIIKIEQKTFSPKEQRALDKVKRANAELAKIRRDQKKGLRKEQDRHKYMWEDALINNKGNS